MDLPAIKNCPFCNGVSHIVYDYFSYVVCDYCGSYGPEGDGPRDSIIRWNGGENFRDLKIKSTKYEQEK